MASEPLANVGISTSRCCVLCNKFIISESYNMVKEDGLETLKELSERWEKLSNELCQDHPYNEFQNVHTRISGNIHSFFVVSFILLAYNHRLVMEKIIFQMFLTEIKLQFTKTVESHSAIESKGKRLNKFI